MKALVQRVLEAEVRVEGASVGAIGAGVLLFLGIEQGDGVAQVPRLVERVLGLRIFPSEAQPLAKPLDRSLSEVGGGLLVVSQFTLAADTRRGRRPSLSSAAPPTVAEPLYEAFLAEAQRQHKGALASGRFGADMKVALVNDGPLTFWLEG
jgi:D-tyrosyl-tRNA(Tyr) deacylase